MKPFLLGALSVVVLGTLVVLLVVSSGMVSTSALWDAGAMDNFLGYASQRSIAHHAKDVPNPFRDDKAALAVGLDHYKENCLDCHAAPGLPSSEFAKGLNPPAPKLMTDRIQKMSDGELFWVVSNGIRMTGMPAFSPTHEEDEIWKMVAFVRHLGSLTEEEKAELGAGRQDESAHHDHPHAESGESVHGAQESRHEHEPGAETAYTAEQQTGATHEHSHEEVEKAKAAEEDHSAHEHAEAPTPAQPEHKSEPGHMHEPAAEPAQKPGQEGGAHQEHSYAAAPMPTKMVARTDAEIIREQKPTYPLTACVVSGDALGKRGEPMDQVVQGRLVRLCCADCKKEVDQNPAEAFKKIDAAVIAAQKPGYPLNYDPVTGEILGQSAIDYVFGTRLVRLANQSSIALFLNEPKTELAKVDTALIDAQRASYPLDTCVVTGKALGSMPGGPIDYLYGTRLVRFCCLECPAKFEQDPIPYLSKIDEATRRAKG